VVGLGLLLQAIEEVLDELLGGHLLKFLFVHPEGGGHPCRVFEPLLEQGLRDVGQLVGLGVLQLHPPEVVEEDLVIEIEMALALHQQGPCDGVEVLE